MQGPAPVSLEAAGDGGAWRHALIALHLAAAGAMLAWAPGLPAGLAAIAVVAAGVRSGRGSAPTGSTPALLAWDGQTWRLGERAVRPRVALDLGGWMLLRLDPADAPGRRHWLPLSAAVAGAAWPPLRAALFSTAAAGRGGAARGRPAGGMAA